MTSEKIVQSLHCCFGFGGCQDCAARGIEYDPLPCKMSCKESLGLFAADLIEQQAARIAELEAKVPRWIPVTERLPETAGSYIVCTKSGGVAKVNFYPELGRSQRIFTHWMPLPEPPETDGGGEDG